MVEETCFFGTILEEDDFSPLRLRSNLREDAVLKSKLNLREEDVLNLSEEEDGDSN